jgi:5'-methylthioadenosine phosphorylase
MSDIKIGLIGGSGMGELLRSRTQGTRHELQTPFGPPSDAIIESRWDGLPVFFLSRHGPGHLLNPSQVPYRANIFALKSLGVTHIIASGAVGSLREEFKPRDLVIADQVIDKTSRRPSTFYDSAAVHVEFAEPFCPVLRRMLVEEGRREDAETRGHGDEQVQTEATRNQQSAVSNQQSLSASPRPGSTELAEVRVPASGFTTHGRGCYVCMEGPAFSTRAESLMHRLWGGDLIGMTCLPETKLAREAEIAYALIALVTDYDCWRPASAKKEPTGAPDPAVLLKEIIANLQAASDNAVVLIERTLCRIAQDPQALSASPALSALQLAIWSDKTRIPREQVEALAPLWKRYFDHTER